MTDDARKLLGGYATGTLTEEEKKALYEAALHDDALFAALADEHALKELLDDSAVRAQLLQATENPRFSIPAALAEWFQNPKAKALTATGVVLLAVIGFNQIRQSRNEANSTVAELRRPATESVRPPVKPKQPSPVQNEANSQTPAPRIETPKREQAVALRTDEKDTQAQQAGAAATPPSSSPLAAPPPPPPPASPAPAEMDEAVVVAGRRPLGGIGGGVRSTPGATQGFRAGALARAAGTSVTPLRYELLRRDAAGSFQPVAPDYMFSPGDMVRIRLTSSRDGAVAVSTNTASDTVSQAVIANTWTEIPQGRSIPITADTARLVVAFAPTEAPTSALLDTNEARAKQAAPAPVSLEIPIRQRKP